MRKGSQSGIAAALQAHPESNPRWRVWFCVHLPGLITYNPTYKPVLRGRQQQKAALGYHTF